MRIHRPGDAAFRRGSPVGEGAGLASAYQPYRPEPEDELVLPGAPEAAEGSAHVDNTPPGFDERPVPPPAVPPVVPPAADRPPARVFKQPAAAVPPPPAAMPLPPPPVAAAPPPPPSEPVTPPPVDQYEPPEQPYDPSEPYDYRYPPPDDDWGRRGSGSGMSPLAIGGFVLLGILAIAVGAVMAGVFTGGTAVASPTGTPQTSIAPSASLEPSVAASTAPSVPASTPIPSGSSQAPFPDGFTARTEPCAEEPASQDGCNSSGSTISGGSVWVWIGWRNGSGEDVLGATIVDSSGTTVDDSSIELGSINGCSDTCNGWARFRFNGLAVGNYTIKVERNGTLAAEATFTVTG
jgi:hypothetical protein